MIYRHPSVSQRREERTLQRRFGLYGFRALLIVILNKVYSLADRVSPHRTGKRREPSPRNGVDGGRRALRRIALPSLSLC